jgi:hypothetical protein
MSGTIRKRGINSWQIRVLLAQRDPRNGRWRYIERHVPGSKRDAQPALYSLSVEVARGGNRPSGRRTVSMGVYGADQRLARPPVWREGSRSWRADC